MMGVRLTKELEAQLEKVTTETHSSKSHYIQKALEQFLENREDYLLAVARLEENNPHISLDEALKEIGLDSKD